MSPSEIAVGKTYCNRGAGKTQRKVIAIGPEHRPENFWSERDPPKEDGVLYEQNGVKKKLYISSFAAWCGKEVSA